MTVVAVAVVHVGSAGVEVRSVCAARSALEERAGPITAARICTDEVRIIAKTCSREEYRIIVLIANDKIAFYTIVCCPRPRTIIEKFSTFGLCGHSPVFAPWQ